MRGRLTDERLEEIRAGLPAINSDLLLATRLGHGVALDDLDTGGRLGVALVCLDDACNRFWQARLALQESNACLAWYLEESPKARLEFEAALTARFYLDYVGLLLYAAAEDVEAFIIHFLGVKQDYTAFLKDPKTKRKLQRKSISSKAGKVGVYLNDRRPGHDVTQVVLDLHADRHWREAMTYRNTWVHEQPPLLKEFGIQQARQSRVQEVGGGRRRVYLGQGSRPQYSLDGLLDVMLSATNAFAVALSALLNLVIRRREELGETFDFEGRTISLGFLQS